MKRTVREVPFILASVSPRRRFLMAGFPWRVRVKPSGAAEPPPPPGVAPGQWAKRLALRKALGAARNAREGLVLGADTLVYRAGRVFGKPSSSASARRMLSALSGRWHTVYTGLALAARPGRRVWTGVWSTRVKMRALSPPEIEYWSARNHDKAGAYAIQARGGGGRSSGAGPFVERWRGDFDNVMGLPRRGVRRLVAKAQKAGYRPIKKYEI